MFFTESDMRYCKTRLMKIETEKATTSWEGPQFRSSRQHKWFHFSSYIQTLTASLKWRRAHRKVLGLWRGMLILLYQVGLPLHYRKFQNDLARLHQSHTLFWCAWSSKYNRLKSLTVWKDMNALTIFCQVCPYTLRCCVDKKFENLWFSQWRWVHTSSHQWA